MIAAELVTINKIVTQFCDEYDCQEKKNVYIKTVEDYIDQVKVELFKGYLWKPLYNWGVFGLIKVKKSKKSIDFNRSNKEGKMIYYENIHSDGYSFILKWGKGAKFLKNSITNITCYKLKIAQQYGIDISKEVFDRVKDPHRTKFDIPKEL